jgi:RimJ/RimL family protein N-acetyltransferase
MSIKMKMKDNRIYLSALTDQDSEQLFKWINNTELILFNSFYKPVHEPSHKQWFQSIVEKKDLVIFGIRLTENQKLIGSCQLFNIHPVFRSAELQIRIGEADELSKGYGKEAVHELIKYGFFQLNLERIYLQVFADNIRAIKAYEKAGFLKEGSQRHAAFIDGNYKDIIMMGILKNEFHE